MNAGHRIAWLVLGFVVLAGALVWRLADLQLVDGARWRREGLENLRKIEWLEPQRGRILDRSGAVLAKDEPQFALRLVYRDFRRASPPALLLHLDRFLRQLEAEKYLPAGSALVAGEPLSYLDADARYASALGGLLRLPRAWLSRSGPLPRRLRGVLRFYVFACTAPIAQDEALRQTAKFSLAIDSALATDTQGTIEELVGRITGCAHGSELLGRLGAWLSAAQKDLALLSRLLGPVPLPGSVAGSEGDLHAWLHAVDGAIDRAVARVLAKAREKGKVQRTSLVALWSRVLQPGDGDEGFRMRLRRALEASHFDVPTEIGFEQKLDVRFKRGNQPFLVREPVSFDEVVALVAGRRERYPGFRIEGVQRRSYPRRNVDDEPYRLLGAVARRTSEDKSVEVILPLTEELDVEVDPRTRRHLSDAELLRWHARLIADYERISQERRRGIDGVERRLDAVLSGREGVREVWRSHRGQEMDSPRHVDARRGQDVQLTVDVELQDLMLASLIAVSERICAPAGHELEDVRASFVVIDCNDGAVRGTTWLPRRYQLESGKSLPFRVDTSARAFETPPPGSIVKPLVALEGLRRGIDHSSFEVCRGVFRIPGRRIKCGCRNDGVPHDYASAIMRSCNSFFGQLGRRLGLEGLEQAMSRFGLLSLGSSESPLGYRVDPGAYVRGPRGLLEKRALTMRSIGYGWSVPPILVARAYAAIATGSLPVLRYVEVMEGEVLPIAAPESLNLDPAALDVVRRGLAETVHGRGRGTARHSGLDRFDAVGKTGTAELSRGVGGETINNAWFAGYLPQRSPRLAFCCVFWKVPDGLHGGDVPAAAVAELLERMAQRPPLWRRYFGPRRKKPEKKGR